MTPADLIGIAREALLVAFLLCAPILAAALVAAIVSGALQSLTRLSEPTIGHIARIAAVFAAVLVLAPWIASRAGGFAERVWALVQGAAG